MNPIAACRWKYKDTHKVPLQCSHTCTHTLISKAVIFRNIPLQFFAYPPRIKAVWCTFTREWDCLWEHQQNSTRLNVSSFSTDWVTHWKCTKSGWQCATEKGHTVTLVSHWSGRARQRSSKCMCSGLNECECVKNSVCASWTGGGVWMCCSSGSLPSTITLLPGSPLWMTSPLWL